MKILFPASDEFLVCAKCWSPIVSDLDWNHDSEGYWCSPCTDFVEVEVRPK